MDCTCGFNTSVIQQCGRIKNRPKGRGIKPACRNNGICRHFAANPIDARENRKVIERDPFGQIFGTARRLWDRNAILYFF
jgi:hypothetical protein